MRESSYKVCNLIVADIYICDDTGSYCYNKSILERKNNSFREIISGRMFKKNEGNVYVDSAQAMVPMKSVSSIIPYHFFSDYSSLTDALSSISYPVLKKEFVDKRDVIRYFDALNAKKD